MVRFTRLAVALAGLAIAGCVATHTYLSYEVVRDFSRLRTGDEVQVVTSSGDTLRGTLLRARDSTLTVVSRERGEDAVPWSAVRILERLEKVKIRTN